MKSIILGVVAVAMSTAPVLALDGPGRALTPSNNVQIVIKPIQTSEIGGSVVTSFIPPYSGEVNVRWEVKSSDGSQANTSVIVSHLSICLKVSAKKTFVLQQCTIRVAAGMPITIRAGAGGANTVSLRNVGLYYNVGDSDGKAIEYVVPLEN